MLSHSQRLKYLLWSASRIVNADTSCPACGETATVLLRRKYAVTALYRCPSCEVMFRIPKSSPQKLDEFYQSDYKQGFTTDCPAPADLAKLKNTCFAGTEKDYSVYIQVLQAIGLEPGSSIFDFGCSWGYGSWQMRQAGYQVYSFEVSLPRARYAIENLECKMFAPDKLPEKMDCFFSAHVIEHLPDPLVLWETARRVIKPGGKVVVFLPNGDPSREQSHPGYHQLWGEVHPLLLSPLALTKMAERHGFAVDCYSSPYNVRDIADRAPGQKTGDELLVLAFHHQS
jgi:SAM-dependent methyltransferase